MDLTKRFVKPELNLEIILLLQFTLDFGNLANKQISITITLSGYHLKANEIAGPNSFLIKSFLYRMTTADHLLIGRVLKRYLLE